MLTAEVPADNIFALPRQASTHDAQTRAPDDISRVPDILHIQTKRSAAHILR